MYKQIDEEGYDTSISGTTTSDLGYTKKDYAPNPEFNELELPAYNGQMEVKDFSLQYDDSTNNKGRTP